MRTILHVILFFVFVLIGHPSLAQKKVSKKDKAEIKRICEVYNRQKDIVLSDFDTSNDSLLNVTSNPFYSALMIQRERLNLSIYPVISFPFDQLVNISFGDSIGCNFKGRLPYKLNVEKTNKKWLVIGFNNQVVGQDDVDLLKERLIEDKKEKATAIVIEKVLNNFASGWAELEFGESSLLKSITTQDCYDYLKADLKYNKLRSDDSREYSR